MNPFSLEIKCTNSAYFFQGLFLAIQGVIAVVFKPITLIHGCTFRGIDSFKFYEAGFVYFCSSLFQKGHGSVAVI